MASPDSMTVEDISGSWTLSKTLSDDADAILAAQGIGFLMRKGMKLGSLTLNFVHDSKTSPPTLSITAVLGGGFKANTDVKKLDGEPEEKKDFVFGTVTGRMKAVKSIELKALEGAEYLSQGWEGEERLHEVLDGGKWVNDGVWGLTIIDGKKYLAKKSIVTAKGKTEKARMVYEYKPLP